MRQPTRSDYVHFVPISVKWGEMDSLGHVNNTVFYRYSEDGRIDYIHMIADGGDTQTSDGPILADLRCSFRQQLRFPADVEIGTRVKRIGRSSFELEQCLFFAETEDVIAVYNTVVVWFDFGAQLTKHQVDRDVHAHEEVELHAGSVDASSKVSTQHKAQAHLARGQQVSHHGKRFALAHVPQQVPGNVVHALVVARRHL